MDEQFSTAAIWRRCPFRLGEVIVEPLRHEIRMRAGVVRVEPRLMTVLTELAAHGDSPATRDCLLGAAWPEEAADEALTLAISRLRRALGAHGQLIATIPKVGYRLTIAPILVKESHNAPAGPDVDRGGPKRYAFQMSALAAVLVLGFWIGAYGAVWAHRDDFARPPQGGVTPISAEFSAE